LAGDRVVLVGDYDSSGLWDQASSKKFRNISHEVVGVWNDFIEIPEKKLDFSPCSTCMEGQD
jgi:hypothetical protein